MALTLTDREIARLILESKLLPNGYESRMQLTPKRGHSEREVDIVGASGDNFRLILRQSLFNILDFSVILAYRLPRSNELFRLRRYNGRSHEHTNSIERQTFYEFHIHQATERYQEIGAREDAYAVPTDRFADLSGAVECMVVDCNFDRPPQIQRKLL
ncbi:MAG: hypothetical protein FJ316_05650 [SAR202 cluster bacterium]|nr:hypothetical protein [SAR202 cluster bacterium]